MRAALAIALAFATGTSALGQVAGTTLAMSCGQAAAFVRAQGAAVLRTGPNTYDRYVSGPGACLRGQQPFPAWVRTADSVQCFIGYRCRETDIESGQ
jgi:hypothetical protein